MFTEIASVSPAFRFSKNGWPAQATVFVALVVQPEGGGGTEAAVIAIEVEVSIPNVAPPVGLDRET